MKTSESIVAIAKALASFQKDVEQPAKTADNPFFRSKYVPIEKVVETINKYGPQNGLSFTQWPATNAEGRTGIGTMLMHESGEFLLYDPFFVKSDKETAQASGSTITYLRRYALSAAYGLTSDEDDDGNNATGNGATNNKTQTKTDDF